MRSLVCNLIIGIPVPCTVYMESLDIVTRVRETAHNQLIRVRVVSSVVDGFFCVVISR